MCVTLTYLQSMFFITEKRPLFLTLPLSLSFYIPLLQTIIFHNYPFWFILFHNAKQCTTIFLFITVVYYKHTEGENVLLSVIIIITRHYFQLILIRKGKAKEKYKILRTYRTSNNKKNKKGFHFTICYIFHTFPYPYSYTIVIIIIIIIIVI